MDVVANYAAGEEAVSAFFSCEGGKAKLPADDDEGPSCNIPDVTDTKIGSCHQKHCIAYVLSTS